MSLVLGISAYYHDSAAVLLRDGMIVAAAQEERFSRIKHDSAYPHQAINYCLRQAGVDISEVDYVGYYEKPLRKFERLVDTYLTFAPRGFSSFRQAMPKWLSQKVNLRRTLRRELGPSFAGQLLFAEHHESHAAAAFFPSPFKKAAILTLDGVGEWATGSYGTGCDNHLELTREMRFPHSLGLLYSAFTYFCGFRVNDGEYKLMGLAPYGSPRYVEKIRKHLVDIRPDGSFFLDLRYFDYCTGLRMTSRHFDQLFDGPPRNPENPITEREMDLAASVQVVTEEIILKCARHLRQETGMTKLCLGGGVALNCVANGKLLQEKIFDDVWIQPAAGDAGGALGVAMLIHYDLLGAERLPSPSDSQQGSFLGPALSEIEIREFFDVNSVPFEFFADEDELCAHTAELVDQGRVVGWAQGRMEFGPRALGARSILADARDPKMQSRVNQSIKFRESFRPFAPIVLQERAAKYFAVSHGFESPYMLITAPVHESQQIQSSESAGLLGLERLKAVCSKIPAVTHVDMSSRIQTLTAQRNGRIYKVLKAFEAQTGCPVMLNTSFNLKDEPIVCTLQDAWHCFLSSGLDVLVMERFVVYKESLASC